MTQLVFVYNANSGKLNALFDAGHKLFSPGTYKCSLCALTFDTFTENAIWKKFRKDSSIKMAFYHIDEFESVYPGKKFDYPVVFMKDENNMEIVINSDQLKSIKTVEELINTISSATIHL